MIFVDRQGYRPSQSLFSCLKDAQPQLDAIRHGKRSEWLQKGIKKIWRGPLKNETRNECAQFFRNKCAYCESPISSIERSIVNHFRPVSNAIGIDMEVSVEHYWWLMLEWNNLYLSCKVCDSKKGNNFPVLKKRASQETPWQGVVETERPLLIDPCVDDPSEHLIFDEDGLVIAASERGEATIGILVLNRDRLVGGRREAIRMLQDTLSLIQNGIEGIDSQLRYLLQDDSPFLAPKRQFVMEFANSNSLEQTAFSFLSSLVKSLERPYKAKTFTASAKSQQYKESISQIERIEIVNFKALEHIELKFAPQTTEHEPWLMLIGENGVGKSSVLKAISLLFASTNQRKKLVPDAGACVTRQSRKRSGVIRAWFSHNPNEPVELTFKKNKSEFVLASKPPKIPVLAYGATRLAPAPDYKAKRMPQRVRIGNLFDPRMPLSDVEAFFADTSRISSDEFNLIAKAFRKLLGMDDDDKLITRREGQIFVQSGDGPIPLREQSDGYQSVTALAGDIMMNLSEHNFDLESARGTVLVDEIGCHLHPQWRIKIVRRLREVFPNVRFIVTTHEPLCLRGTMNGEIYQLMRHPETGMVVSGIMDIPPGITADELLTGQWFGLGSTLDWETSELMNDHYKLLSKSRKTKEDRERQQWIQKELSNRLGVFENTSLERTVSSVAAEFIRETAAQKKLTASDKKQIRDRIKKKARQKLKRV